MGFPRKALICISVDIILKIISEGKTDNVCGMVLEKILTFWGLRLNNTEEKVQSCSQNG